MDSAILYVGKVGEESLNPGVPEFIYLVKQSCGGGKAILLLCQ